ncbi:uncharacterized protein TrAtP1_008356 [Trichoderma atroviride]|uniref:uncharacterized protein n=1 Tax=Hypocrea atroviridis TaxID=63577 RepID=UPI00331E988C|nr:hypothetical protein TrAtP1_008356 [Trichoderma atroviride]
MQSNQRHQTTLPHRRAPVPKLSLVTSLASRPRSEVPHTTTTSPLAKPLILSDPNARRPELYSQQLRDQASTPPTVTATATRNVNASFLDDPTPIEPEMADQHASRALRDSHDLSLSPRNITRDSLVNNMLLSLDQFSLGQTTTSPSGGLFGGKALTYDDPRPWANDTTFSRGRGGQHYRQTPLLLQLGLRRRLYAHLCPDPQDRRPKPKPAKEQQQLDLPGTPSYHQQQQQQ